MIRWKIAKEDRVYLCWVSGLLLQAEKWGEAPPAASYFTARNRLVRVRGKEMADLLGHIEKNIKG